MVETVIELSPVNFSRYTLEMVEGKDLLTKVNLYFGYNRVGMTLWALCPFKNMTILRLCFNDITAKLSGYNPWDLA